MDRNEDREILRKGGFAEKEVVQLNTLRKEILERERRQALITHRRMEFIRWLVSTGRLSEQIAS